MDKVKAAVSCLASVGRKPIPLWVCLCACALAANFLG